MIQPPQRTFTSYIVSNNHASEIALVTGKYIDIIGLWRRSTGGGVHLLAWVAIFCYVVNTVLQIIAVFLAKDTQRLFECLSVLTFIIVGIIKLTSLQRNHEKWQRLICDVKQLENKYFNLKHNEMDYKSDQEEPTIPFSEYIQRYNSQFQSLATVLARMYFITCSIYLGMPFVDYAFWKIQGQDSGYLHFLPVWAPWDKYSFTAYMVSASSEVLTSVYCVAVHFAFDITATGLIIFVCGQFAILRDYSELIGGRGKSYAVSKKREDNAYFRIKTCHQTQIFLASYVNQLNKLLKDILGIYFTVVTVTLCSVGLRLILEELGIMQLITLIQYTCGILTQLFLYCYYGSAIEQSALQMGEGPFGATMWCLSPRVRRELALLGLGMMKPRPLRAGPFFTVNLPSFLQILRAAYSYYAVIRNQS